MIAIPRNTSLAQSQEERPNADSQYLDEFLPQDLFLRMLFLERKRTERSGRPFVLMLLESARLWRTGDQRALRGVFSALANSSRDTDTKGWYRDRSAIGVIYTELGLEADGESVAKTLRSKVLQALSGHFSQGEMNAISISFRIFPENWGGGAAAGKTESPFYDGLFRKHGPCRPAKVVKRCMDIAGSLFALTLGFPIFLLIALAVKMTSRGPVLFRQTRVGQYGRTFGFLKFRSMYVANDDTVHREYVKRYIANADGCNQSGDGQTQYKLIKDHRVTRIGHFLRASSLDELPQFLNVLKGDMSLVGPRPPLPYEVECYGLWHRARLLAAKPGITGLWQVNGRSRVKFDDMVRMDLRYANSWSIWLDLKILLQTPRAVLSGNGAH